MGEEEEFIKEVTQFYLGSDIKGVVSPSTFNQPCAILESYDELSKSSDDDDKELAGKFAPRKKYLAYCVFYKDDRGKEVDENNSPKFLLITSGVYQDILELYLDDDEWGDMTDPVDGYDIKVTRAGSGKLDTVYSVKPCKPTPTPKEFKGTYDMEAVVGDIIPDYDTTKGYIEKFLGIDPDDDDEPAPAKKRTGTKKVIKKKRDL